MKAQERYDLMMKSLSEGKNMSEAAREQGVTPALLSQIRKKITLERLASEGQAIQPVSQSVSQEATASTAEA